LYFDAIHNNILDNRNLIYFTRDRKPDDILDLNWYKLKAYELYQYILEVKKIINDLYNKELNP